MSLALVPNQSFPQQFVFAGKYAIRVIDLDGETWFVAVDVCTALGLGNPSMAVSRIDEDEKTTISLTDSGGRPFKQLLVNEPGLYTLILRSDKPAAKDFKRWITHEVLPAIRKTGAYISKPMTSLDLAEAILANLRDQERRLAAVQEAQAEQDQRLSDIEVRQTAIEQGSRYFTVSGFAARTNIRVDNSKANQLGRYAGRYSRKHGYPVGQAPDARYGKVNTYHEDVLRAVFGIPRE